MEAHPRPEGPVLPALGPVDVEEHRRARRRQPVEGLADQGEEVRVDGPGGDGTEVAALADPGARRRQRGERRLGVAVRDGLDPGPPGPVPPPGGVGRAVTGVEHGGGVVVDPPLEGEVPATEDPAAQAPGPEPGVADVGVAEVGDPGQGLRDRHLPQHVDRVERARGQHGVDAPLGHDPTDLGERRTPARRPAVGHAGRPDDAGHDPAEPPGRGRRRPALLARSPAGPGDLGDRDPLHGVAADGPEEAVVGRPAPVGHDHLDPPPEARQEEGPVGHPEPRDVPVQAEPLAGDEQRRGPGAGGRGYGRTTELDPGRPAGRSRRRANRPARAGRYRASARGPGTTRRARAWTRSDDSS